MAWLVLVRRAEFLRREIPFISRWHVQFQSCLSGVCMQLHFVFVIILKLSCNNYTALNVWAIMIYLINERANFYVLLTVHPDIMMVFFTNLMHKFFILVLLLHSSTCFEHHYAHLQEDNRVSTASGIFTLFRWLFSTQVTRRLSPLVTCVLNSHPKGVTIPDAVLIQFVFLKMSTIVLETYRRV